MLIKDLGDDFILDSIPLKAAALILALEQHTFKGVAFSEEDTAYYSTGEMVKTASGNEIGVRRALDECLDIEPKGRVRQARDQILKAMLRSIEGNELKTDCIRRELDGKINEDETWIDLGDIEVWANTYGIDLDDYWDEYRESENDFIDELRTSLFEFRKKRKAGIEWKQKWKDLDDVPEHHRAEYLRLVLENNRLRSSLPATSNERPISTRAHNSILTIIAAMAYDCYKDQINKPFAMAKNIQAAAEQIGLNLSDDTIAAKLKEALTKVQIP